MDVQTIPISSLRKSRAALKGRAVTPQARAEIAALLADASRERTYLIEHLHKIQDAFGHISAPHIAALAEAMRLSQVEVYEVATFYHHFDVVQDGQMPPPATTIRVCDSVACMMAGAEKLKKELENTFGEDSDVNASVRVISAPCVGACDRAPVAVVGQRQVMCATVEKVSADVENLGKSALSASLTPNPLTTGAGENTTSSFSSGGEGVSTGNEIASGNTLSPAPLPEGEGGNASIVVARKNAGQNTISPSPWGGGVRGEGGDSESGVGRDAPGFLVESAPKVCEIGVDAPSPLAPPPQGERDDSPEFPVFRNCADGTFTVENMIATLSDANLRGLGGAGFPAGKKWQIVRGFAGARVLVVNADEGEPGTFKDRHYLETNPWQFWEGVLIAAWAVEAQDVYIYLRDEYHDLRREMTAQLAVVHEYLRRFPSPRGEGGDPLSLRERVGVRADVGAHLVRNQSVNFAAVSEFGEGQVDLGSHAALTPTPLPTGEGSDGALVVDTPSPLTPLPRGEGDESAPKVRAMALDAPPPQPSPAGGGGYRLNIELRRGAGAYICGEESALIESLEGKRGLPRLRPPYIAERGVFGRPTLAHNVETLYWIPEILTKGAAWWSAHGRNGRSGLRSFSVSGRVKSPGVKRAPAGISLNELIAEFCGGMADGHTLYGYLPGGASGGILPASLADVPLDFDTLQPYGAFIGSAAIVVFSEHDQARDIALNLMQFFKHESCGQCTPCRAGTEKAVTLMQQKTWDEKTLADLSQTMIDASICGLGQAAPNPVLTAMKYFPQEFSQSAPKVQK